MVQVGDTVYVGFIQDQWNKKWSGRSGVVTKICMESTDR